MRAIITVALAAEHTHKTLVALTITGADLLYPSDEAIRATLISLGFKPAAYDDAARKGGGRPPDGQRTVERPWVGQPQRWESVPRMPLPDPDELPVLVVPKGEWTPNEHQDWGL